MCGRFTLHATGPSIAAAFALADEPQLRQRFNIAPTQSVAAVRQQAGTHHRELVMLRWGLVPFWAQDRSIGQRLINARAETVATKPAFRRAFKSQRCLIVADGFYEWQNLGAKKQPFYIRLQDGSPFGMAGLWERWDKAGDPLETCTILTTAANSLMAPLHERMPVILSSGDFCRWLDPAIHEPAALVPLLQPFNPEGMVAHPVSTIVNRPAHDAPDCIEPQLSLPPAGP